MNDTQQKSILLNYHRNAATTITVNVKNLEVKIASSYND